MAAIYDANGNYAGEDSNGGTTTVVANPPNPPTTNTVPNTTTNTKKVVYQTAAKDTAVKPASDPSQFPAYDNEGNLQPGFKINEENGQTYYAGVGPDTKDTAVQPASDPSQFPQYDDNGNLMPGFKINEENGQPYYAGVGPVTSKAAVDTNNGGEGFGLGTPDGNGGFVNAQGDPVDSVGMPIAGVPPTTYSSPVNNPYYGLTPTQLQDLGGADPTDPYIRARLGIPQLPGSTLNATSGFGFGNLTTNLPSIDNALGTIKGLFSGFLGGGTGGGSGLSSLFTNFSATVGGLFGGTPTASTTAATTGSGTAALVAPTTPSTALTPVDATTTEGFGVQTPVDPTTLEGFGVQAPVDPTTLEGYGIQATVDPTTLEGYGVPGPTPVDANNSGEGFGNVYPDGFGGFVNGDGQPVDANGSLIPTGNNVTESAALVDPGTGGEGFSLTPDGEGGYTDATGNPVDQYGMPIEAVPPTTYPPADVLSDEDAALYDELAARPDRNAAINTTQTSALVDQEQGSQEAAMKSMAQKQATIQARYKQPGNTDWRVRLSLAPGAKYLYNAGDAGILKPLAASGGTDGVIFPYTPSITTTYSANYEQYDLVHSNYRGLFYKNSRVGDIQIRGVFTAQNTTEANYLLAVIHFFRSATKMFYGQDPQRGTPPPICLLNGLGGFQFSDHPVVISSFNYTLPNDVDYIRTTNPNNFGLNLNNRYNPAGASLPAGGSLSGLNRLVNALLPKGAQPPTPAPNTVVGSVTNNTPASYVPTKMEIDITLIPAQTRAQISKQFSLAGFANGDLLKGGFW